MKKSIFLTIALTLSVVWMIGCHKSNIHNKEVVKDSYSTEEEISEEITIDKTEEKTTEIVTTPIAESTVEMVIDTATNIETTTVEMTTASVKETTTVAISDNADNYIYEKVRYDSENIKVLGDLKVSQEELSYLEKIINDYGRNMSFKVVSIDGSKGLSYNNNHTFFAASAIKAPYLLYCHKQIEEGNGTLDEEMVYKSPYYKEGSGIINKSKDGTPYTLSEIMRLVFWCSDNSGYIMCTKRWGVEDYNRFLENIGCANLKLSKYNIWVDKARVEDLVIAWKSIYDYFKTDTPTAKHMYNISIDCKYSPLKSALPGYTVAQKYGTCSNHNVFCDGAIIYGKNNTYILAWSVDSANDSTDKAFVTKLTKKINEIMDR